MNSYILPDGAHYTKEGAIVLSPFSAKEIQLQKRIQELELELIILKNKV